MKYEVMIKSENIFDILYPYKIKCLGKQIEDTDSQTTAVTYFFYSHGNKFELKEISTIHQEYHIELKQVKDFNILKDSTLLCFTGEIEEGLKKQKAEFYKDITFYKDGFYIFKSIILKNDMPYIGGVIDIYKFQPCNLSNFKSMLNI